MAYIDDNLKQQASFVSDIDYRHRRGLLETYIHRINLLRREMGLKNQFASNCQLSGYIHP